VSSEPLQQAVDPNGILELCIVECGEHVARHAQVAVEKDGAAVATCLPRLHLALHGIGNRAAAKTGVKHCSLDARTTAAAGRASLEVVPVWHWPIRPGRQRAT